MNIQSIDTVLFDYCALRGRLAVGIVQERIFCGKPRGQSGGDVASFHSRPFGADLFSES